MRPDFWRHPAEAPQAAPPAAARALPVASTPCREPRGWRQQFARPHGLGGRFAGWLMARNNTAMNAVCLEWLALAPADRVLEIGFGHGRTLQWIAERAPSGFVAGVDPSAEMLRMAARRNRAALQAGRVQLALGSAEALPFEGARFDKLLAANCVQFWDLRARSPRRSEFSGRAERSCWAFGCASEGRDASRRRASARPALRAAVSAAGFASLRSERRPARRREVMGLFATR